jgi:hypothetical protein
MNFPNTEILQDMFNGFQSTPLLWTGKKVHGLEQFMPEQTNLTFNKDKKYNLIRLGKWVEKFVAFQLRNQPHVNIIYENLQIKNVKETIGELDLLFLIDTQPIHLEIIYKFYLFVTTTNYENSLNHWVGPNRKDNLVYKLDKLKDKQLPLLFKPEAKSAIKEFNFDIDTIKQMTCFKAQLFKPYNTEQLHIHPLNEKCIVGDYINYELMDSLKDYQFYIPTKLEWLCKPRLRVNWIDFKEAQALIKSYIIENRSPLCWLKSENNILKKVFITWW